MCEHFKIYGSRNAGSRHTEACRARLISKFGQSEAGSARLQNWSEKVDRTIAERIVYEDQKLIERNQPRPEPATDVTTTRLGPREAPTIVVEERATSINDHTALGSRSGALPSTDEPAMAKPLSEEHVSPSTQQPTNIDDADTMDQDSTGDLDDTDMGFVGSLEPSFHDSVTSMLLSQLGHTSYTKSQSYGREKRRANKRIISEIYSPPRITAELRKRSHKYLVAGLAMDLTVNDPMDDMPWDFSKPEKRERAREKLRSQKPYLLVGSPECTQFCTWQNLNAQKYNSPEQVKRREQAKIQAIAHIEFVISLYEEQIQGGRYFLHEHPSSASSWKLESMLELLKHPSVSRVNGDQCQFGAEAKR